MTNRKLIQSVVQALDELSDADPEEAHVAADDLLLQVVPEEVREAYDRVANRIGFWYG